MRRKATFWIAAAAALTTAACGLSMERCEGPGGMPPSYRARNYDPRLTRAAASIQPVIEAIAAYRRRFGALPKNLSQLPVQPSPSERWIYTLTPDGQHYSLWHALGWDPSLRWEGDGLTGRWVFDPGDGSPEKEIQLKP